MEPPSGFQRGPDRGIQGFDPRGSRSSWVFPTPRALKASSPAAAGATAGPQPSTRRKAFHLQLDVTTPLKGIQARAPAVPARMNSKRLSPSIAACQKVKPSLALSVARRPCLPRGSPGIDGIVGRLAASRLRAHLNESDQCGWAPPARSAPNPCNWAEEFPGSLRRLCPDGGPQPGPAQPSRSAATSPEVVPLGPIPELRPSSKPGLNALEPSARPPPS